MKKITLLTLVLLFAVSLSAKPKWHEQYRHDQFKVADRTCIVVHPTTAPNGRWIVRPAFLGAFPSVDEAMLERGFTVAYCDVTHEYANPKAVADYQKGNKAAIGALVGGVMKMSKGKANPRMISQMLAKLLG